MSKRRHKRDARLLEASRGYLMLGMSERALAELRQVADPEPFLFDYHSLRGEALRDRQEFSAALDAFHLAIRERPDDVGVLMGMAWCYKRVGQLARSISTMHEAYRVSPKEPVLLFNLACYYALDGDKPQALTWLGRALRMDADLRRLIPDESDFDRLRDDPDFQLIVGEAHVSDPR